MLLRKKLEKAVTVDVEKFPHRRLGQGPGSVDPNFAAGLPFPVPEILEFRAFRNSGKFSSMFPIIFPQLSSGTPETIPETVTAFFSKFLICPF